MYFYRDFCLALLITVNCLFSFSDGARILAVFPIPSISHQVVFRPLTLELAKRGHEVIVFTPDPIFPKGNGPANFTEVDWHFAYKEWRQAIVQNVKGDTNDAWGVMDSMMGTLTDVFEMELNTDEVKTLLRSNQHFDLILVEAPIKGTLIFSHFFKAPVIQISSLMGFPPNPQVMGYPSHPILYPEATRKRVHNLSLREKIAGVIDDLHLRYLLWKNEIREDAMLRRNFGDDTPTMAELSNNVDMLFLNVHPMWDNNRPVPPGVVYMGALHQNKQKELPADLKSYLDSSKHGVIYMSFGTNVDPSQLPVERIQIFCEVFSKLPYDVLWKWNGDVLPGKPSNVKISKWLPQSDLLRHPKIKLFITQGGLQSTDEAITAGVPLLVFPMLGDQWFNAEKHVHFKIGLKLELAEIDEAILERSIRTVIEDESYKRNMKRLGETMRDQPQSSLERTVWWAEYVLRHGGAKHLRSAAANVSWAEYLMLDVVAVVLGGLSLVLVLAFVVLKAAWRAATLSFSIKVKKQ